MIEETEIVWLTKEQICYEFTKIDKNILDKAIKNGIFPEPTKRFIDGKKQKMQRMYRRDEISAWAREYGYSNPFDMALALEFIKRPFVSQIYLGESLWEL